MTRPTSAAIPHGTANGYGNYRCRCDTCRAAWTAKVRQYRERRRQYEEEGLRRAGGQLLVELVKLEKIAIARNMGEALGVLQMHILATRLDLSLDALRRGEL